MYQFTKIFAQTNAEEIKSLTFLMLVSYRNSSAFTIRKKNMLKNNNDFERQTHVVTPHIANTMNEIKKLYLRLNRSINLTKSEHDVQRKDEILDRSIKCIYYIMTGLSYNQSEKYWAPAEDVMEVLKKYGKSATINCFGKNRSLIRDLLVELKDIEIYLSIKSIGNLDFLVPSIEKSLNDYEKSYRIYEKERARKNIKVDVIALKKKIIKTINEEVIMMFRSFCYWYPDSFGELGRTVDMIIIHNNEKVKERTK